MTESFSNNTVQEKTFCELQIKPSSEINSSQKNNFSNDHVMESILLPLDHTDSGCYKKILGSDDVPMDISSKCSDNSNSHRAADVATSLISKEPAAETHPPPSLLDSSITVKRSMSSAFMISSLLSTKTVSPFSNVLSQASSSNHSLNLKVTSSTSSFVPVSSSCITRIFEDGQNSPDTPPDPVKKLDNPGVSSKFGLLKESMQENSNVQNSDVLSEEHSLLDNRLEADDQNIFQGNNISLKTSRPARENEHFLSISDSEMDIQMVKNEPGTSGKEITAKQAVSFCDSDSYKISSSYKNVLSECIESNAMESEDLVDDILIVEANAHRNSGGRGQESGPADMEAINLKINREASIMESPADLTSDEVLEDSKSDEKNKESGTLQESNAIQVHVSVNESESSKKQEPDLSNVDTNKQFSNSMDICDVEYSKNLVWKQPRSDYNNCESGTDIDKRISENNISMTSLGKLSTEDSKYSLYPPCESKDINKSYSFGDGKIASPVLPVKSGSSYDEPISYVMPKTSEIPNLNSFPERDRKTVSSVCEKSEHLRDAIHSPVNDGDRIDHETNYSDSLQETKPSVSQLRFSEMKVDVNRLIKAQDKDTCIKVETLDKMEVRKDLLEGQDLLGSQNKRGDNGSDSHFLSVEDTDKSESVSNSFPKYSFKNILRMPKNKIVNCKKSCAIKDTDCVMPTKTFVQANLLTTGSSLEAKLGDQHHAELKVASDQNLKDATSPNKMELTETVHNNESTSERKRFQVEETPSAPKRLKLDSKDIQEEKKTKDDVIEISNDVPAEKFVASTDPMKQKNVSISNEALQSLITLRAKAYMKNQKQANLDRLNLRTRGMQSASNLWKETAKHLERSVLELAALNQKLESRKAHFLAVKRLASKSVGIQVGDESTSTSSFVSNVQPFPASNSTQRNSPLSTQSSAQRRPGRPSLSSRPVVTITAATPQERKIPPTSGTSPDTQINSVNLIDLTDDEDIKASSQAQSNPVNHKLALGSKAPTPVNGYVQPTSLVKGTSGSALSSSNQTTQPTTSGSLFPPSGTADVQLVTTNSSPAQQPSPAHTQGSAITNTIAPGQSNTSASSRALTQSSTPPGNPVSLPPSFLISNKHPAPLPSNMDTGNAPPTAKKRPPKPILKISRVLQGIVLSWNMPSLSDVEKIATYQLYAYQESEATVPRSNLWKKVGEVKSLPLPMACTLTQFQEGNKYHFAVRAVDQYGRWGSYSDPSSIYLGPKA